MATYTIAQLRGSGSLNTETLTSGSSYEFYICNFNTTGSSYFTIQTEKEPGSPPLLVNPYLSGSYTQPPGFNTIDTWLSLLVGSDLIADGTVNANTTAASDGTYEGVELEGAIKQTGGYADITVVGGAATSIIVTGGGGNWGAGPGITVEIAAIDGETTDIQIATTAATMATTGPVHCMTNKGTCGKNMDGYKVGFVVGGVDYTGNCLPTCTNGGFDWSPTITIAPGSIRYRATGDLTMGNNA